MTYDYQIGDGAHALDQQQWLDWHRGYQVVDAAGGSNLLSAGTNAFDVDAAAGDINFGGTTVTCAAETINLSADVDPDNPKKVTVYRDGTGTLQYVAGIAEPAQDSGETRRDAYRPAPPTLEATDAVVLGTVWLAAGASSVVDNDIRDRRLPAEANVETLTADSGTIDTLSGTSADYDSVDADGLLTNIVGDESVTGQIHYASMNHADLPDFQTAVNNASGGDTVALLPGEHNVTSTQTVDKRLNLIFYGGFSGDGTTSPIFLLDTGGQHSQLWSMGQKDNRWIYANDPNWDTTGTIVGAEYRTKFRAYGELIVQQAGGIGHYINGTGTNNVNNVIAELGASQSQGDPGEGIRVEGPSDANALILTVPRISSSTTGIHQIRGIGNQYYVGVIEYCDTGIEWGATEANGSSFASDSIAWIGDLETEVGARYNYYSTRNTVVYGSQNTTTTLKSSADTGENESIMSFNQLANFEKAAGQHSNIDMALGEPGGGLRVVTPDGTDVYRIRVDNTGTVVTDGPF